MKWYLHLIDEKDLSDVSKICYWPVNVSANVWIFSNSDVWIKNMKDFEKFSRKIDGSTESVNILDNFVFASKTCWKLNLLALENQLWL